MWDTRRGQVLDFGDPQLWNGPKCGRISSPWGFQRLHTGTINGLYLLESSFLKCRGKYVELYHVAGFVNVFSSKIPVTQSERLIGSITHLAVKYVYREGASFECCTLSTEFDHGSGAIGGISESAKSVRDGVRWKITPERIRTALI